MKTHRLPHIISAMVANPLRRRKGLTFISLLFNACYIAYLTVIAVFYRSTRYGTLVGYYLSVWLIQGGVSLSTHHAEQKEHAPLLLARKITLNFLFVGCALPLLGGVMSAAIIQMAIGSYPDSVGVWNIVINAVVALAKLSSALIQLIRARLIPHPVACKEWKQKTYFSSNR